MYCTSDFVFDLLVWLLIGPVFLPLVAICFVWKCISVSAAKVLYYKSQYVLSPVNFADLLECTRKGRGISGFALRFGNSLPTGRLDITKVRDRFAATFINNGNYKKYPVFWTKFVPICGFLYKVANLEDNLNLTEFIRETSILWGEAENEALSRIMGDNAHFQRGLKQWEIIVLRGNDITGDFIIFKIHHALADGYSIRSLLDAFGGTESPYRIRDDVPTNFLHKARLFIQSARAGVKFVATLSGVRPIGNLLGDEQIDSTKNIIMSKTTVKTWKLKEISKNTNSSFLAVIISLHFWSLQSNEKWLRKHGVSPSAWSQARILFPVGALNHPAVISKGRDCCNHMTMGVIKFPMKIYSSPIYVLESVQSIYKRYTDSGAPQAVQFGQETFGTVEPYVWAKGLMKYFAYQPLFETLINPFPLWNTKYHVSGIEVKNVYFLCSAPSGFFINGIQMTPFIRGDDTDISVHSNGGIFNTQDEMDNHVGTNLVNAVDMMLMESRKDNATNIPISVSGNTIRPKINTV